MKKLSAANIFARPFSSAPLQESTYASLKIKIHNGEQEFKPGQEIKGTVELIVERQLSKVKCLKLEVVGYANCKWRKGKGKSSICFEGQEKLMENQQFFIGSKSGEPVEVHTGTFVYEFTSEISQNAVSSYIGTYGEIVYKAIATLDLVAMKDIVAENPFSVIRMENLNGLPWLRSEITNEVEYNDTFICCRSQPLGISLKVTHKCGFGLGEKITVEISICNKSSRVFNDCILSLDRVETCNSLKPVSNSIKSRKIITYLKTREIKAFVVQEWKEVLTVPYLMAVTSVKFCDNFQITYELNFTAKSDKKICTHLYLPITIGHIALNNNGDNNNEDDQRDDENQSTDAQSFAVKEAPQVKNVLVLPRVSTSREVATEPHSATKWTFVV